MEKETVLILLLLKPMTKTSRLNDIAIMVYHGGCPVLKKSIPFFLPLFWWKSHERQENKKEIVFLLKPMTKTCQLNGKSRCFQTRTQSQIAFQGGGCVFSWTVSIY